VIGLEGAASAGSTAVYWQGGTGTFSDPASAITTYQPGPGDAGTVELSFCALDACGNTNCASIELPIASNPDVVVQGNTQPCLGSTTLLTATGADTYIWSNGQTGPFNAVGSNGTYTVTGSTACGTAEATITVAFVTQPEATITGTPYLCPTATLVASGGQTYLWSTGDTSATIVVSEPGGYSVAVSNACGSAEASVDVLDSPITAGMMASPVEGPAPLLVNFTNFSLPQESEFLWDFGDGNVSSATSPVHLFTDPGVYEVVLTATLGDCPASNSLFITVLGNDPQEVVIRVPNVFSPNGDGVNDVLEVISTGIVQLDMYILNRWGQLVKRLQGVQQVWDGRTVAGQVVPEGTYYYELRARGVNGVDYELRGTITVLR
jgi:gliding motility-associated-like protein